MKIPNDKSSALRYLLLRHLWQAKANVTPDIYCELTNSLKIETTDKTFLVKWKKNGKDFRKIYDHTHFRFFIRGDKIEHGDEYMIDHKFNDNHAMQFVKEAFDINKINYKINKESFFANPLTVLGYAVFPALLWISEGKDFFIGFILLTMLFICEIWHIKGKFFIPLLLIGFIFVRLTFTASVGTLTFLILQFLDPNNKFHRSRMIISGTTTIFALLYLIWNKTIPFFDVWIMFVIIASISVFLLIWVVGSHFRSFPLLFPLLSIGMYLDGHLQLSIVNLCCAAILALIYHKGRYIFPLRRKKFLFPREEKK